VPYKDKKVEKLYYTIGEVSKELNINPSTVRFWEKEFDFISPKKNSKGNRIYTHRDKENIGLVYYLLKEQKLTIEGARKKIKNNRDSAYNQVEAIRSLQEIKNLLNEIKEEL